MTTNQDLHELVAAYALGALDADECRSFESHLTECERCRTELAGLGGAAGTLAFAVEGPAPSGALRDRILSAAREELPTVVALRPRRTRLYAGTALAAAACAALAIGLWAAFSGGSSQPRLAVSVAPSGTAQLSVSGLDPAPAGKAYEIWVIPAGKAPQPAGLFTEGDQTGVPVTQPVPDGATVAITLERAQGATTPTPPILLQTTASA
jgi:anti-sigma-K factor RskA